MLGDAVILKRALVWLLASAGGSRDVPGTPGTPGTPVGSASELLAAALAEALGFWFVTSLMVCAVIPVD